MLMIQEDSSDEEIDYAFKAAKVLGSIGITDELSDSACQRLGKFAEKHNSLAMFHTHGQVADPGFRSINISHTHLQTCLTLTQVTTTEQPDCIRMM
jgi:hypothetical protein